MPRLLFEFSPRALRNPRIASLVSTLTERQVAVYYGVLLFGQTQGHFDLTDPPRVLASNFVALEDGYQMDVLTGRLPRTQVISALHGYTRAVTGQDPT